MEPPELAVLRQHVPDLIECPSGQGSVLIAPGLQGRIFCMIDGMMVHRLDTELLANPHADQFNNFGGNSLWPAPEGGPFAFNYLPGTGWCVQDGVNKVNMTVRCVQPEKSPEYIHIGKEVELTNRRGTRITLEMRRELVVSSPYSEYPLTCTKIGKANSIQYVSTDILKPLGRYSIGDVIFAPWSLEQFPLSDDVVVFASTSNSKMAMNWDYYARPQVEPVYDEIADSGLALRLAGPDKFQFGLREKNEPTVIGSLDRTRELLILRHKHQEQFRDVAEGEDDPYVRYFNIADNDQPRGPWSAADMYSIFYGAGLGFYELETIAPAWIALNHMVESVLRTTTTIYHGDLPALENHVQTLLGLKLPAAR